jgi:hypothetical protein
MHVSVLAVFIAFISIGSVQKLVQLISELHTAAVCTQWPRLHRLRAQYNNVQALRLRTLAYVD